ncbi:MAG TPA: hypothetical protein PKJ68_05445 [Candidatus Woesebacteria bacterium]|nr:hypothetical protein [Candidatus Woesebacteria bacterium]
MQDTSNLTVPTEKIDLIWDESDHFDETGDEYNCTDLAQIAFEYFLEEFSLILQQISPAGFFFVEGRNIGWRCLSGHLHLTAGDAGEFISKAFPVTSEWTLRGSFDVTKKILEVFLYHHDAPTGEFYKIVNGK